MQTFQYGNNRARTQPRTPIAFGRGAASRDQHVDTQTSVPQTLLSADEFPNDASNPKQATPSNHTKDTGSSAHADTSSSHVPASATPPQKRKRSRKADQLPSLQDAPGVPEKLGDQPLRLVIVGHNPSDHAW